MRPNGKGVIKAIRIVEDLIDPITCGKDVSWEARSVVIEVMTDVYGSSIQRQVDDAMDRPIDRSAAETKARKVAEHHKSMAKKLATEKLVKIIGGHDFTEKEVVEIWRTSLVERVQKA